MTKRYILFAASAVVVVAILVVALFASTSDMHVILYSPGHHTNLSAYSPDAILLGRLVEHAFKTATGQLQLLTLPSDIERLRSTRPSVEVIFSTPQTLSNAQSRTPIQLDHLLVYIDNTSNPSSLVVYYGLAGTYMSGPYINNRVFDKDIMELLDKLTTQ